MQYRKFGKTGVSLSVLGFGCMRLPELYEDGTYTVDDAKAGPLIRAAYDHGVNYFDAAWGYCHEDCQRAVGKAVKPFRDKIYLSTKLPMWNFQDEGDFWKYLMLSLERLDTDYIDFYHFHSVNQKFWKLIRDHRLIDKMRRARDLGLIRHISFSFHDDPSLMNELVDTGAFDSLLCQYNLIDRVNEQAMAYAKAHGVGVVVMGPLAGGNLAMAGEAFQKRFPIKTESAADLALRFVLGNPSVTCALSGMSSLEDLEANLRFVEGASRTDTAEWSAIAGACDEIRALSDLYCTGCGYCEVCPKGIQPASVFKAYNMHTVWGLTDAARRRISSFGQFSGASAVPDECIGCGACSAKCPQKLDIPKDLARAWQTLKPLVQK